MHTFLSSPFLFFFLTLHFVSLLFFSPTRDMDFLIRVSGGSLSPRRSGLVSLCRHPCLGPTFLLAGISVVQRNVLKIPNSHEEESVCVDIKMHLGWEPASGIDTYDG